jgi:hypothetical protein
MNLPVAGHDLHVFATTETLNERIAGFAALVGLVLVLVTLFTSQRSGHIEELREGTRSLRSSLSESSSRACRCSLTALSIST